MSYTYLHTLPRHYALPIRSDILDPGDFLGEPDAALSLDAAVHHRFDDRPHIFLGDGALVFLITRRAAATGDRLVLQVALAALVADRAIERMIDEQELHHPFACLLDHRAVGLDDLPFGRGQRARRLRLRWAVGRAGGREKMG